jgi:hypothetical protein
MKPFFSSETSMQVTIQQLGGGALAWQMSLLAAILIVGTLVGWLLYLVIKAGVRDGMSEALRRRRQIRQADLAIDGGLDARD